jgi:Ca2+-binding EF-hand superfamily protein
LEFSEFITLAAQFLIEEDAEEMQNELKEAFRLYDKEGQMISSYQQSQFFFIC